MVIEPRYFPVYRDLGLGLELVDRSADELTDAEILELGPVDQAYVLRAIGCVIEDGQVVTDPALDDVERRAA